MTKSNKDAGQAKNPGNAASSEELAIPTLGMTPATPGTILQDGETRDALIGSGAAGAGYAGNSEGRSQQVESQRRSGTLADVQAEADAAAPARAMHRPAILRQEREQYSEVEKMTLEMPTSGSLDAMRRPDQLIEPVADLATFRTKAETLAFMEEMVEIRIHETGDLNAENPVVLGVNGRQVAIRRGVDTIVRRKYVEMLLRAKPEALQTRLVRDGNGDVKNFIDKTRALKYPFSILRDDNPKGRAWERKVRSEA